jgi:hypothetical protein
MVGATILAPAQSRLHETPIIKNARTLSVSSGHAAEIRGETMHVGIAA